MIFVKGDVVTCRANPGLFKVIAARRDEPNHQGLVNGFEYVIQKIDITGKVLDSKFVNVFQDDLEKYG